jgi:hypothetical protein
VAPDRRFGLPHPLDADPSEDSSPRKSGLWESFKRALGSPPADAPVSHETEGRPPEPPLPAAPPPSASPRSPSAFEPDEAAPDAPARKAGVISPNVPFLDDLPFEPLTAAEVESPAVPIGAGETSSPAAIADPPADPSDAAETRPELSEPAQPSEPPTREPRLARGLASFSRDNARREKKFAHLLRDESGADDNHPDPPRRRR